MPIIRTELILPEILFSASGYNTLMRSDIDL